MTSYRGTAENAWAMNWFSDLSRLRRLNWSDQFLLAETCLALASASIAVRLIPFRRLMTSLSPAPEPHQTGAAAEAEIERLQWAIQACARRLPWRIVCFQKGLALYRMLRRRSIASTLHYGVALDGGTDLKAHVWVSRDGKALVGGEEAPDFACLATFPASDLRSNRLPAD